MPKELEGRSLSASSQMGSWGGSHSWVGVGEVFHFSKKPHPNGDFLQAFRARNVRRVLRKGEKLPLEK